MQTRVLFLDDSGKPDTNHPSGVVVIAGFSIPSDAVPTLSRRVLGAKAKFYPQRGDPSAWEIKAADVIKPNPWKRSKNREFAYEIVNIVSTLGGTCYSASITKANMNHQMGLSQTMPLQLQVLVEHFEVECRFHDETGMIVADWSSHHADHHASNCVASFVASRKLNIHPSVYYASSLATPAIQVADLLAGVRRRLAESDLALLSLQARIDRALSVPQGQAPSTITGRQYRPRTQIF
jgi:hypothetical protein